MGAVIGFAFVTVGIGALLSAWAHFADTSRALRVLLYVVFGGFSLLILLGGIGLLLLSDEIPETGITQVGGLAVLGLGLGLGLPLVPFVRRVLARVMPFDPDSVPDMVGLSLLSAMMLAFPLLGEGMSDVGGVYGPVQRGELVVQTVIFVLLAFVVVGTFITRDLGSAVRRLGLWMPTLRQVALALALVVVAFIIAGVAGALTQVFQPELVQEIEERMRSVTQEVTNVPGALLLGLSAGIGEEIFFRGAIQPRYGIVFTSLVFTAIHVQYDFSLILLGVFALSVMLGLERKYMGTVAAIITHAAYNTLSVLLQAAV